MSRILRILVKQKIMKNFTLIAILSFNIIIAQTPIQRCATSDHYVKTTGKTEKILKGVSAVCYNETAFAFYINETSIVSFLVGTVLPTQLSDGRLMFTFMSAETDVEPFGYIIAIVTINGDNENITINYPRTKGGFSYTIDNGKKASFININEKLQKQFTTVKQIGNSTNVDNANLKEQIDTNYKNITHILSIKSEGTNVIEFNNSKYYDSPQLKSFYSPQTIKIHFGDTLFNCYATEKQSGENISLYIDGNLIESTNISKPLNLGMEKYQFSYYVFNKRLK